MEFMDILKDKQKLMEFLKKRAWGPVGSVVVHIFAVIILLNLAVGGGEVSGPPVEVVMMETRAEELEQAPEVEKEIKREIEKLPEPEVPDHEIRNDAEYSATEEISDIPNPGQGRGLGVGTGTGVGDGDQAGLQISGAKSPLVMKGLFGSRSAGGRGKALSKYGGGSATEGAVLRALRWLKKEQKPDGSWDTPPTSMTSWALLCYLAHGETPASEEFGPTVEKAIKYLASTQASWPKRYEWAIATYALSEAYGMTKVPMLKDVALKGVDAVIKGQRPTGGWCYGLTPQDEADDTSVMGWCAQALKASKLAGIEADGLEACIKQAIKGFKANAAPTGGFGYRGPGATGLTGTGVLCMQLLGAAKEPEVRNGLQWLESCTFKWDDAWMGGGGAPVYYWYYITQAKFHAGGDIWNAWNKQFSPELVKSQIVLKGAGDDGKDIGFWELPKAAGTQVKDHSTGLVYNTTLCCLMLEVYYRYLPTYKPPEELKLEEDGGGGGGDISIEVK